MKNLLTVVLTLFTITLRAQPIAAVRESENDILTCRHYRRGLYRSFEEFRHNSPSITRDFTVSPANQGRRGSAGSRDLDIVLKDTVVSRRILLKEIWGFCDGDSIYINSHQYQENGEERAGFTKLNCLGRYAYFEDIDPVLIGRVASMEKKLAGYNASASAYDEMKAGYVLNLNNGKFYLLNEDALEKILAKDAQLLAQYQHADKKGGRSTRRALMMHYIEQYNQRHPDEVKLLH